MNAELRPALEEIAAVLKRRDLAGLILVANKTHVDFLMRIDPSWSCAWLQQNPDGSALVRVRCKREDYASKDEQKRVLEQTVGTFVTFNDVMRKMSEQNEKVLVAIAKSGVDFLGKSTRES